MLNLGDFLINSTVIVPFHTFNAAGASVTMTGITTAKVKIYKGTSVTERASAAGITLLDTDGIDLDARTGIHGFSVDLSDNTDAGFYASGNDYYIVLDTITIDAQTVSLVAGTFSIENRNQGLKGLGRGVVGSSSTTTSVITSSILPAAAVTDQFKGRIVIFDKNTTTANLRCQATDITASTSGGVLTVTALTTAPVSGDTFSIV